MLHLAFLLLAQAAVAETPAFKAELKDMAAQGKAGPSIFCEGTSNLPDGALIDAALYYDHVNSGKAIAKEVATMKGGKFTIDFQPFPTSKKNLSGKYIAVLRFNPTLQNQAFAGFSDGRSTIESQFGNSQQFQAEAAAFRAQVAGEVQAMSALGDQVLAKIQELKGKPADDWKPFLKEWGEKAVQIQIRADPAKVREYYVLGLDLIGTSGLERMTGILNSAARYAAAGKVEDAREGITRLRQTCEYWISEIASPKLTNPREIVKLIESARKQLADMLADANANPLPARRKFLEMNALLQKSLPEDFQPLILEAGTQAADFFRALSDKEPNVRELHAKLDGTLERMAAPLK